MFKKKLSAVILSAFCLTACSAGNDAQQTAVSETTTVTEATVTTTEITEKSTVILTEETTAAEIIENDWTNPEEGLVFFVQPSISQRDEDSYVDDWECRDTEVLHDFHYDGEWQYAKELIFVFSNYSDEPVTIDSINIVSIDDDTLVKFNDGSSFLDIDLTVEPQHKTDYVLRAEDFDYSACESGAYNAVANIGLEGYGRKFFINNCELHTEKYTYQGSYITDETGASKFMESDVYAPAFLNDEQQHIFAQAHGVMREWFWCSIWMTDKYSDTHTPDDFMTMLKGVFTEEYAKELAAVYIDENGNFLNTGGDRGTDVTYHSHCFIPVSADENKVEFKAVVTYCHCDNPYKVSFEEKHYVMLKTENGWRVDRFDLWN